jgi:nucleoside-diphosphate-sugar epimerase
MLDLRRRQFITLLGGAAATWPLAARAQQTDRMRRIGVLMSTAVDDPPVTAAVHDMEAQARASGLDWIILRGGMLHGPGTARMFEWNELALVGRLTLPGDGSDYLSLIHVEDMASAVVAATEAQAGMFTVNIVDDEPVTYRELFGFVADLHGAPFSRIGRLLAIPVAGRE